jgi:hypothetical protein
VARLATRALLNGTGLVVWQDIVGNASRNEHHKQDDRE